MQIPLARDSLKLHTVLELSVVHPEFNDRMALLHCMAYDESLHILLVKRHHIVKRLDQADAICVKPSSSPCTLADMKNDAGADS